MITAPGLTTQQVQRRARALLEDNMAIIQIAAVAPDGVAVLEDMGSTLPAFGGIAIGMGQHVRIVEHLDAGPGTCQVRWIVTAHAVLEVTSFGLVIRELAPQVSAQDIQATTPVPLKVGPDLREIET